MGGSIKTTDAAAIRLMLAACALPALASCATPAAESRADRPDYAEGRRAFRQGEISGRAEACGLDWQTLSFRPMMAHWRRLGRTQEQLAVLAAMHGAGQGTAIEATAKGGCTEAVRRKVRSQLPLRQ